ncbi:MAG: nucleotidyltransferase domain-containing protein [Alistipes senegalensis]|nr:nucleotidyltransferase domain-containing protein [Oxalobacter formigenes]MCM1280422.1 nucleotidyltransferase domain-containing protein [Alistipes senegalensis]
MSYKLAKRVENDIVALARRCGLKQAILFGSRARGDNRERSDIDLAIKGGNTAEFIASADDEINTLLMLDIVDLGKPVQAELLAEISRDGIMIYEEI